MQKIKIILVLISTLAIQNIYAQDSIVFTQSNSVMFSNRYVFFNDGTFKHYFHTDDGRVWYGVGKFTDKGRKRTLKFEDADLTFNKNIELTRFESNFQRIILKRGKAYKSIDYYYTSKKKYVRFKRANTVEKKQ
jgi:hypothetical protein